MSMRVYSPFAIAGGFPPGLNTASPATDLEPDETPDGYGYDLSVDGRLAAGTIPSGTARVEVIKTVSAVNYNWYYNRLWRFSGTTLYYGAPFYDSYYYPQRSGMIGFDEDASPIVEILPVAPDGMMILKATGGYVLSNCADTRALFQRTDIMQEFALSAAANCMDLNGVVYVSNANGLFAYESGKVVEVSRKIRNNLTGLVNVALTSDFNKQYLICGTALVYEPATQKLFRYSGADFRFTTRQFHLPDYAPLSVDRLHFVIEHNTQADGALSYQVRFEDEDWSETFDVALVSGPEKFTVITEGLQFNRSVRRFQVRITALSAGKYIKGINLDHQAFDFDAYST